MIHCSVPTLQMVLGALVTQPQRLNSLALGQPSMPDLRMAAIFTSLATLALSDPDTDNFDISALQALPHLHTLSLDAGEYCTKELPKTLLSLRLEDAILDFEEPTTCVVPLQNLKVIRSRWTHDHLGILAYTTLQELYLDGGSIDGSYTTHDTTLDFGESYDGSLTCPDLSVLKFVRVLYMNVSGAAASYDEPIDWNCLYCLSSLQALTLHSTTQGLKIDRNLTVLGNLSCLTLIGTAPPHACVECVVSVAIDVDWGAMPTLQNVFIESDRLHFGPNILSLLHVSGLRRVTFLESKRATAELPADFAALVQGLIVQRPEVTLTVNGSRKLAV
ncbi:TPA: hypothetical protein ACH3X2_007579 [Trebouxia sp. C0005]